MTAMRKLQCGIRSACEWLVRAVRRRARNLLGKCGTLLESSTQEFKLNCETFPKLDHDAAAFINFVRDNLINGN